jgi:hypothetical protein
LIEGTSDLYFLKLKELIMEEPVDFEAFYEKIPVDWQTPWYSPLFHLLGFKERISTTVINENIQFLNERKYTNLNVSTPLR